MNAHEVTKALEGTWHGRYGLVRCPCHDDRVPSLTVRDAAGGNTDLVVHCFAGCDWRDVKAALRQRGLLPVWTPGGRTERPLLRDGKPVSVARRDRLDRERRAKNTKRALRILRGSRAAGIIAETYFAPRGITVALPPTVQETAALRHWPTKQDLPALVCAVQRPDGKITGVHRTFLTADFTKKAGVDKPRMMLGPVSGNAIRLAPATEMMALAEGLEDGLSILQTCPDLPVWCCLTAGNLAPQLPAIVKEVVMCLDGDLPGSQAFRLSEKAIQELLRRGLKVRVFRAPPGMDHNDLLQQQDNVVPLKTREMARV